MADGFWYNGQLSSFRIPGNHGSASKEGTGWRIAEAMKRIVGKTFKSKTNWPFGPWHFSEVELENCHFDNCMSFASWLLRRRFHARNVRLLNCSQFSSGLDAAILEDIVVDGWQNRGRNGYFRAWACAFRHVTLRGRIGYIKFRDGPEKAGLMQRTMDWTNANRAYYATVDWALDIREARFTSSPELHFIPGSLSRRDPETQVLVTKKQATAALAAGLAWGESVVPVVLQWFVEDGLYDDVVVAAPRASKKLHEDLAALDMLRQHGLAA